MFESVWLLLVSFSLVYTVFDLYKQTNEESYKALKERMKKFF